MKKFLKNNWILLIWFLYLISPLDFVPEVLFPILGPVVYSDDIILLLAELLRRYIDHKNEQGRTK